jgi:hypothetical protein
MSNKIYDDMVNPFNQSKGGLNNPYPKPLTHNYLVLNVLDIEGKDCKRYWYVPIDKSSFPSLISWVWVKYQVENLNNFCTRQFPDYTCSLKLSDPDYAPGVKRTGVTANPKEELKAGAWYFLQRVVKPSSKTKWEC